MALSTADATRIVNLTFHYGGATFTRHGDLLVSGYVVGGLASPLLIPHKRFSPETLVESVDRLAGYHTLGTWEPRDDYGLPGDVVWLEPVDIFTSRDEAETMGRHRGELAIFDLLNGEEIAL
ncbi:hypothetical protein SEA_HONK_75 [Microbacterium phage Honk]|uniref:Uncharacterized protein n=1 Tax=Microbacterium phage Honk TaxID=2836095 RepID=A0A8F3E8E0_9CAUD|nr:hypothetical protein SEA_HONK_75 [Microbacterium phage Honk]